MSKRSTPKGICLSDDDGNIVEITDSFWIINGFKCSKETGCVFDYACLISERGSILSVVGELLQEHLDDFDFRFDQDFCSEIVSRVQEDYVWE